MRIRGLPSAMTLAALTVGTLEVTGAATFASTVTATGQFLAGDGSAAAPSHSFTNSTGTGMYQAGNALRFSSAGTQFMLGTANDLQMQVPITFLGGFAQIGANANLFYAGRSGDYCFWTDYAFAINPTTGWALTLRVGAPLCWGPGTLGGTPDTGVVRLSPATLRQGLAPSATPVAQTFTLGESSRPGTDVNVGGSKGTMRPGLGTGTGPAPDFAIQAVVTGGSGSAVQSYGDVLVVGNDGATQGHVKICALSPHSQVIQLVPRCSGGAGGGEQGFIVPSGVHFKTSESGSTYVAVYAGVFQAASGFYDASGVKVLGAQGAAVADATGAGDVVAQLNTLLARCRAHGVIAT